MLERWHAWTAAVRKELREPWTLAFLVLLLAFVAFKWRYLGLPFFWDEAWVYAPAVKAMYKNGPSLLPDAIDPLLSRGHPLLFHAAGAAWMHVFGTSRTAMHAFALVVSIALLKATYLCGMRIASRQAGLGAALLLVANEMFLAQSAILLPEVLLALTTLLAAWAYVERRPWAYMAAATCALLTKEPALILVLALLAWQLLLLVVRPPAGHAREGWRWVGVLLAPVGLVFLLFLYQYHVFGWFLYPEHVGNFHWVEREVTYNLKLAFTDLFEAQGQHVLTYAFAFAVPVLWRGWDRRWAFLVIPLYVAAIKVLYGRWSLPGLWTIAVPALCLGLVFALFFLPAYRHGPKRNELACIGFLFTLGFMGFTALNFFSDRYLFCVVPFIFLGMAVFFDDVLAPYHRALPIAVMAVFAGVMIGQVGRDDRTSDIRLNYADAIAVHQQAIPFCEQQGLQDSVFYGSFLERTYMADPGAGYLVGNTPFPHVRSVVDDITAYAITTDLTPPEIIEQLNAQGLRPWQRFSAGHAWAEVLRKPPL